METKGESMKMVEPTGIKGILHNRWVMLVLYTLVSALTGLLHGGFSEWQPIIYKTGAFSYLCNENDDKPFMVDSEITYKSCDNRDKMVNNLSTISFFVQFTFSPINGYILDRLGPKICFLYGQFLILLGFALLAAFGSYSYVWHVFFFLMGFSTDAAYLPLLQVSKYFPGRESLVFGIMGSARSSNFGLALLLKIIFFYGPPMRGDQFYILALLYICTVSLFSFMVGIFIMPLKRNTVQDEESGIKNVLRTSSSSRKDLEAKESELMGGEELSGVEGGKLAYYKQMLKHLWSHPQKYEYLIVVFICSMSVLRLNYYMKSNRSFFIYDGYNITTIFSIATVLAFIPAPFFGYLTDRCGPLFVLTVNNTLLLLSYICLFFRPISMRYLSILLFFFFVSFCFSVFHCYIDKRYPKEHFGKLCGFMFVASGLVLLFNFYLTHLTDSVFTYKKDKNYFPVVTGLSVVGFIVIALCLFLRKYKNRVPRP